MRARSFRLSRSRTAIAAITVGATLVLTGCSGEETLANQWNSSGDNGFVAGDGATTTYPVDQRPAAVEFSGTGEHGEKISSDQFAGSVTVVNFWYAGCAPCRAEAPDLNEAYAEFESRGVKFLGVNTRDQAAQAIGFAEEFDVKYPSVMDVAGDRGVQRAFAGTVPLNAVPTTLILDTEGRVAHRVVGQVAGASQLKTLLNETLDEAK